MWLGQGGHGCQADGPDTAQVVLRSPARRWSPQGRGGGGGLEMTAAPARVPRTARRSPRRRRGRWAPEVLLEDWIGAETGDVPPMCHSPTVFEARRRSRPSRVRSSAEDRTCHLEVCRASTVVLRHRRLARRRCARAATSRTRRSEANRTVGSCVESVDGALPSPAADGALPRGVAAAVASFQGMAPCARADPNEQAARGPARRTMPASASPGTATACVRPAGILGARDRLLTSGAIGWFGEGNSLPGPVLAPAVHAARP